MKKKFVLTLMMFLLALHLFAQDDCKMCGTWTGNFKAYTERYNEVVDNKIVIRVQKYGDTYAVRVKEIDVQSGDVFYWRTCTVTSHTDNNISFFISEPMKWDEQDYSYYTYTSYYTLTYSNGILYYNQNSYVIDEYDKDKKHLGTMNEPGKDCYHNIPTYHDDW